RKCVSDFRRDLAAGLRTTEGRLQREKNRRIPELGDHPRREHGLGARLYTAAGKCAKARPGTHQDNKILKCLSAPPGCGTLGRRASKVPPALRPLNLQPENTYERVLYCRPQTRGLRGNAVATALRRPRVQMAHAGHGALGVRVDSADRV